LYEAGQRGYHAVKGVEERATLFGCDITNMLLGEPRDIERKVCNAER
jgi:hypothetical protein